MSALLLPAITASSSSGSGSSRRARGRGGPFRGVPGTMFSSTEQHRALLVGNTNGGGGVEKCVRKFSHASSIVNYF